MVRTARNVATGHSVMRGRYRRNGTTCPRSLSLARLMLASRAPAHPASGVDAVHWWEAAPAVSITL